MKKLIKVTSVLGAVVMGVSATGVGVANAASITSGDTTTATVGLEKDENAKVELTNAPVLDFGTNTLNGKALDLQASSVDDPITVVDAGVGQGWKVTVKGTTFDDAAQSLSLKGAVLTLNGVVGAEDTSNASGAPTTGSVDINTDDQPIFTAATGNGVGTWHNKFNAGDETAKLAIPDGNVAGKYVSTLTWTLADTPA
ncbi:WxL domain-containing protein [Companilactobacillus sp.]|uniref:WxL domain-containing protein n=1 Tax=Companilactobacillus sp. TaxID=2767905 RepID=UPI00262BCAC0|nr:WxL domain-containing protein [Companilactobacillus sp.]